jgi:hypothetical protein
VVKAFHDSSTLTESAKALRSFAKRLEEVARELEAGHLDGINVNYENQKSKAFDWLEDWVGDAEKKLRKESRRPGRDG